MKVNIHDLRNRSKEFTDDHVLAAIGRFIAFHRKFYETEPERFRPFDIIEYVFPRLKKGSGLMAKAEYDSWITRNVFNVLIRLEAQGVVKRAGSNPYGSVPDQYWEFNSPLDRFIRAIQ